MSTRSRRSTGARRSRGSGCSRKPDFAEASFDQEITGLDGSAGLCSQPVATGGVMERELPEDRLSADWPSPPPREDIARVPFPTVLASIVGLWLTYFLLTTLRWELLGLGMSQELLWPRGLVSLSGVLITLGLWLVLRLFDARPLWIKIAAAL